MSKPLFNRRKCLAEGFHTLAVRTCIPIAQPRGGAELNEARRFIKIEFDVVNEAQDHGADRFSWEEAEDQFGHMLEAFEYGAPPHGGIAPGIDRLVALMAGEPNIREVMAFPKTAQATDLMANSPSPVVQRQRDHLHITLAIKAKEKKA